jgi:prepilin-type N-terminal cleavage/methylation domain-containing protein
MCLHLKTSGIASRRGLTLAELLIAMAVMGLVAAGMASLALTVGSASDVSHSQWLVTQHARVTIQRIERTVAGAYATSQFPGFIVVSQTRGTSSFPDALVVWKPEGDPANPDGLPLFSELVIFTPDHDDPTQLLEIQLPLDTRTVPSVDDASTWRVEIDDAKSDLTGIDVVRLTNMLRAETLPEYSSSSPIGAIRFEVVVRPSMDEWDNYVAGSTTWENLPWAQDIHGSSTGLRHAWCRFELQLQDHEASATGGASPDTVYPFFGSAAIFTELKK